MNWFKRAQYNVSSWNKAWKKLKEELGREPTAYEIQIEMRKQLFKHKKYRWKNKDLDPLYSQKKCKKYQTNWLKTILCSDSNSLEWLERHNIPIENGKYVLFHGSPKTNQLTTLKAGSLLAETKEDALFFAARDRGLNPQNIIVYKVLVNPEDILPGVFAYLKKDYQLV
jgi:hypothetical protein